MYDAVYECMLKYIAANPPADGTAEIRVGVLSLNCTKRFCIQQVERSWCSRSHVGHFRAR